MRSYLNLLPMGYRRKQLILLRLRHWAVVWVVALIVTGLLGWTQWSTFRAGLLRLASLKDEYQPIERTSDEVERFRQVIEDLQQRESLVLELADEQSMFTLMGLLSRAARACEGRVSIQQLVMRRQSEGEAGLKSLSLTGLAEGNQDVATFVDELRKIKAFVRVDLKKSGIAILYDKESRTYNVECSF